MATRGPCSLCSSGRKGEAYEQQLERLLGSVTNGDRVRWEVPREADKGDVKQWTVSDNIWMRGGTKELGIGGGRRGGRG